MERVRSGWIPHMSDTSIQLEWFNARICVKVSSKGQRQTRSSHWHSGSPLDKSVKHLLGLGGNTGKTSRPRDEGELWCCVSPQADAVSESNSCLALPLKRRERDRQREGDQTGDLECLSSHHAMSSHLFQMLWFSNVGSHPFSHPFA